jgi:hypothetical protein
MVDKLQPELKAMAVAGRRFLTLLKNRAVEKPLPIRKRRAM